MSDDKSTEQRALEFAEKREHSGTLKNWDAVPARLMTEQLRHLARLGLVSIITDGRDNEEYYSLTSVGFVRLQEIRSAEMSHQLTPAGQNQLDLILEQLIQINAQMQNMNTELVNIREGIYHGREAIPAPVQPQGAAGQAAKARRKDGRGDRAADTGE